jgi:hypothetical protein
MNHKQRAYALDRVKAITKAKIEAAQKKHTVPGADQAYVEGSVASGLAGLTGNVMNYSGRWYAEIDSSKFPRTNFDRKAAEAEIAELMSKSNRIQDEIMLGDAEEALAAIRKFETE